MWWVLQPCSPSMYLPASTPGSDNPSCPSILSPEATGHRQALRTHQALETLPDLLDTSSLRVGSSLDTQ